MSAQANGLGIRPTKCVEPHPGRPETAVDITAVPVFTTFNRNNSRPSIGPSRWDYAAWGAA
ncbi:MAG TPA: hypothetical protein VGM05_12475 [Planctomycetaceae bacterium]|jgi:hypothetical protein